MNDAGVPAATLSSRRGVLVAIDVGGTNTKLACYAPARCRLRRSQLTTRVLGLAGRPALRRIILAARHCSGLDRGVPLLGLAAVFPGVLQRGRLIMADNAPELDGLDLNHEFAAAFGDAAIVLDNDVKAGALAEHAFGALRGVDEALYVNVGTGLAAAAIIRGEIYRGCHNAALEIGYQLASVQHTPQAHQRIGLGEAVASMQSLFSGASLDALAREMLGPACTAKDAFESTRLSLQQDLWRRLDALAAQLANLAIAFDVERIAIGGGVSRDYPRFGEHLAQLLERVVPFPPTLSRARFADDAPLWGALELARKAADASALPDALFDVRADVVLGSVTGSRGLVREDGPSGNAATPGGGDP